MSDERISLRAMTADDLAAARAVWRQCAGLGGGDPHDPHDSDASWRRFLERNAGHSFVAATPDGRIVATVMGGHDGRRGFIYRLAVAPSHRRRGLARRLADACLASLRAAGISRILLFVFDDNDEAVAFWTRYGARHHPDMRFFSLSPE